MKFFSKEKISQADTAPLKEKKYTLLLVDDEAANLRFLEGLLEKDYNILTANDGQEALELVTNHPDPTHIDLIITDQRMPRKTGVEFLKESIPALPNTIRMILTGFTDIDAIIDAINQSKVYKYLTKPLEPKDLEITIKRALEAYELEKRNTKLVNELRELNESLEHKVEQRTKELQIAYQKLEKMSLTDPLTGLNNRRYFQGIVSQLITKIFNGENNSVFSFLLLDLDHFKNINDTFGHDAGDYILTETSAILKKICSDSHVIRWGGEEFLVILDNKKPDEIKEITEEIRKRISEHRFEYGGKKINQTVSIGFACFPFWKSYLSCLTWEQVLQLADLALYSAKKSSRNGWVGLAPSKDKPTFNPENGYKGQVSSLAENENLIIEQSFSCS